jgi:hypothetical protein
MPRRDVVNGGPGGGNVEGMINVICTSDAMGRGVDISIPSSPLPSASSPSSPSSSTSAGVDLVVSYDLFTHVTTYVHRAGRTARGGNEGDVVTIISYSNARFYKEMMRAVGRKGSGGPVEIRDVRRAQKRAKEGILVWRREVMKKYRSVMSTLTQVVTEESKL